MKDSKLLEKECLLVDELLRASGLRPELFLAWFLRRHGVHVRPTLCPGCEV
ncbi:MAG: hypothetical protein AB1671_19620 [Thermodesulfobacteriota bacterium]|jgi:hypothetical protein